MLIKKTKDLLKTLFLEKNTIFIKCDSKSIQNCLDLNKNYRHIFCTKFQDSYLMAVTECHCLETRTIKWQHIDIVSKNRI